jgi:hypothetical protein
VAAFLLLDALVALVVVAVLPRLGGTDASPPTSSGAGTTSASADALAGYPVLRGNQGWPIAVGRPWGTPCAPVRLVPGESLPAAWRARLREVVAEAADGGVPVVPTTDVPDERPTNAVGLDAVRDQTPLLPDGRPQRLFWQITTDLAPDARSERILGLQTVVFPASVGDRAADQRRVLRTLLARSFGLDGATRPGSGLTAELASTVDRFSPADLAALRAMAGCS